MAQEYYVGWRLDRSQREKLLKDITPRYARVVADHVTLVARVAKDAPLPKPVTAKIVGVADDGEGVQALVVAIDGTTDRPDGSTYHITWSLGAGRKAVESNAVIKAMGWSTLPQTPLKLSPMKERMS